MKIRELTSDEIELLVKLRLDFIRMTGAELSNEKSLLIINRLNKYFRTHILSGDFIAFAAAACMSIGEKPAGPSFVTVITATLWNVITYPEHRKKEYAACLVRSSIQKQGS